MYISDLDYFVIDYSLNFLTIKTVALPIGFLVGTSFTLGFISGGLTSVLMINNKNIVEN